MAKVDPRDLNRPYIEPDPDSYTSYQREIYGALRKPIFSTQPAQWEALARARVPASNFGYVFGSASSGSTYYGNRAAFERYRLRPHMLVNATRRDMSVELFGVRHPSPLLVAPVGVQNIMHDDAEEATARAARKLRIPYILSSAATRTIEQVALANGHNDAENGADGTRWFQLYWPRPQYEEVTASMLRRAKAAGYSVLVVTLDTFTLAWRPTDLDQSYLPFAWGDGCQIGHSDPAFNARYDALQAADVRSVREKLAELWTTMLRPGSVYGAAQVLLHARTMQRSRAWLDVMNSGTYREWAHLAILKRLWDGPIVLKGIQTVEDAHRAIEHGMDGIIVSNHGGRQVDGAIASLDALAEIGADARVRDAGLTVLFDSGIRTGSDVLKALALGAHAVLIGRPFMYGLAIAGQAGVEHVLRCILADTDNTLANMGKTRLADLGRSDLQMAATAKL